MGSTVFLLFCFLWFEDVGECSGLYEGCQRLPSTSVDFLALLRPGEYINTDLPWAPRMTLAVAPTHRLLNIKGRWEQKKAEWYLSLLLWSEGCRTPKGIGIAGWEGRQESEPASPCTRDRLVDVFVGKGAVHWLRTSCKHGPQNTTLVASCWDRLGWIPWASVCLLTLPQWGWGKCVHLRDAAPLPHQLPT